jgi:hypothetical protein
VMYNVEIFLYKFTEVYYKLYIVRSDTNSFYYYKLNKSRSRIIILSYISIVLSYIILVL